MAYGTGGKTTKYNTHTVGTGGYGKITQESEIPFSGYTNSKEVCTHYLEKRNDKYYLMR